MKKLASLALLLLAACGTTRIEEIIPRYVVLTTFEPGSQEWRQVEWLADLRFARVVRFSDIERDRESLILRLRELDPSYVAVLLRPDELDTNFQLAFLELACRIDRDIFPDFSFGYLPARDARTLKSLMAGIRGAEAKVEKRLQRITRVDFAADESARKREVPAWVKPTDRIHLSVHEDDAEFLHKHFMDLKTADFLILHGTGTPEGIAGFPSPDVSKLRLDTTTVFSGAHSNGVTGAAFEADRGLVARKPVPPERSFAQRLLANGATAVFASLGATDARLVGYEWTAAILHGEPLGTAMKRAYDAAIMTQPSGPPTFPRLIPGRKPPEGLEGGMVLAATRVLLGDPILMPHVRETARAVGVQDVYEGVTRAGDRVFTVRYRVEHPECVEYFTDPFSDGQRLHLRVPLPRGTRGATANLRSALANTEAIYAKIIAQAPEMWRGDEFLHVLIHGKELAQPGLVLTVDVVVR